MVRLGFLGVLFVTGLIVCSSSPSIAESRNQLSRKARLELRSQIEQIRTQMAQAEAAAAAVADETRICITRAADSCSDGNNCDPGRECRKNTSMIRLTDCACYDKKKASISVGDTVVSD